MMYVSVVSARFLQGGEFLFYRKGLWSMQVLTEKRKKKLLEKDSQPQPLLTHCIPMDFSTLIYWKSPFAFKQVLGVIFQVYLVLDKNCCQQTVVTLIRRCMMRRLIQVCTVCLCILFRISQQQWVKTNVKPKQNWTSSIFNCVVSKQKICWLYIKRTFMVIFVYNPYTIKFLY